MNKTNEQMLAALLKDLNSIEACILRERIVKIMETTEKDILEKPKKWEQQIISPGYYMQLAEKVTKHLGMT